MGRAWNDNRLSLCLYVTHLRFCFKLLAYNLLSSVCARANLRHALYLVATLGTILLTKCVYVLHARVGSDCLQLILSFSVRPR